MTDRPWELSDLVAVLGAEERMLERTAYAMRSPFECLAAIGISGNLVALYLLCRMTVKLNWILPSERRMSLAIRGHWTGVAPLQEVIAR